MTKDTTTPSPTAKGLLGGLREACSSKARHKDRLFKQHRVSEKNAQMLARMFAHASAGTKLSFDEFLGSVLDRILTAGDRKVLLDMPESMVLEGLESIFREPVRKRAQGSED